MEIPFGYIEDGVLYRSAIADHDALKLKEIGEEQEIIDTEITSFVSNYDKLSLKLSDTEQKIDTSGNKGSFLSSIQNIKHQIPTHPGLGDYDKLLVKIEVLENMLSDYVSKNRLKNTDIKKALLQELDLILKNNDHYEALEQIKSLKIRWVKTGAVVDDLKGSIEEDFQKGVDTFYAKLKEFESDKKELFEDRIKDYQVVISKIESIVKKGDFSNANFEIVKELQKTWKSVGRVSEEAFKSLNAKYWELCQTFFDSHKGHKKDIRKNKFVKEKENLATRKKLLEEMNALIGRGLETNLAQELTKMKTNWRNAGSVPPKVFSELQNEFHQSVRAFEERQFILKLARSKFKGFDKSKEEDRSRSLIKVTYDLLSRDENEFKSFEENMDKMHINKGSFVDMLESKLAAQRSKIEVKKSILKELKSKKEQ